MRKSSIKISLVFIALTSQASYLVSPARPITPSTGTPVFVRSAGTNSGTGSSLTLSFGTLPKINDIVIVGVASGTTPAGLDLTAVVTDNQNNGYNRVNFFQHNNGTSRRISLWCTPVVTSSGTYTTTVTFDNADIVTLFALEYSGTTCNQDKSAGNSGGTSPYACGSITTINPKDLLLAFLSTPASTGTINYTAPTGFTIRQSQGVAATGDTGSIADNIVSATGTYTPTYTADQNLASSSCMVAALTSLN